jgi:hypothetical protein
MALDILKIVIGGVIGIIGKILYDFLYDHNFQLGS